MNAESMSALVRGTGQKMASFALAAVLALGCIPAAAFAHEGDEAGAHQAGPALSDDADLRADDEREVSRVLVEGLADQPLRPGDSLVSSSEGAAVIEVAGDSSEALDYYSARGTFAAADGTVSIADDEAVSASCLPIAGDLSGIASPPEGYSGCIALIDTGVVPAADVAGRLSALQGGAVDDGHGHGSLMLDKMRAVYPEAEIVSIKAIGDDGVGSASAVYAAIKMAAEMDAGYINLSVSASAAESNECIARAISEAVGKGATVVGAAGNDGANAAQFVPGGVDEAVVVGSMDSMGFVNLSSNSGETVDVYVEAQSTSEACAAFCAFMSKNGIGSEGIDWGSVLALSGQDDRMAACMLSPSTYGAAFDGAPEEMLDEDGLFRVAATPMTSLDSYASMAIENYAAASTSNSGSYGKKAVMGDVGGVCKITTASTYGREYQWRAYKQTSDNGNLYRLYNLGTGASWTASGSSLVTRVWTGVDTQKFYCGTIMTGNGTTTDAIVVFRPASNTGVSARVTSTANGTAVSLAANSDGDNYFRWRIKDNGYYVQYNGNGATSGSMSNDVAIMDKAFTLKANAYSRIGHVFGGWATSSGGSRVYNDMASVTNLTTTRLATAVLYAVWNALPYPQTVKVRYENADGSWGAYSNVINENRLYGSTVSWSRAQDATYQAASISYTVTAPTTKYVDVARRTATNTIQVRYENADGSWGSYSSVSSGNDRVGQTRSWSRAQDATYQAASATISCTATAQTKQVSVGRRTYRTNINVLDPSGAERTDGSAGTFSAWYGSGNWQTGQSNEQNVSLRYGQEIRVKDIAPARGTHVSSVTGTTGTRDGYHYLTVTSGDACIAIRMAYNTYTIAYNGNGAASGSVGSTSCTYGSNATLASNGFSRPGYLFKGWNTSADGSGTSYSAGQTVKNLTVENGRTITLYAQWEQEQLVVEVPAEIQFSLRADGTLVGPANGTAAITNRGNVAVAVSGIKVDAASGMALSARPASPGEFNVSLRPEGGAAISLADHASSGFVAPAAPGEWLVRRGSSLRLLDVGGVASMAGDAPVSTTSLGRISWKFEVVRNAS